MTFFNLNGLKVLMFDLKKKNILSQILFLTVKGLVNCE